VQGNKTQRQFDFGGSSPLKAFTLIPESGDWKGCWAQRFFQLSVQERVCPVQGVATGRVAPERVDALANAERKGVGALKARNLLAAARNVLVGGSRGKRQIFSMLTHSLSTKRTSQTNWGNTSSAAQDYRPGAWPKNGTIHAAWRRMIKRASFAYGVVVALAVLLYGAFPAQAATVYFVRAGATGSGSGSDWNNAYTSLPATMQRGATYYVAGGSYPSYTFNTAQSGTTVITVKKATASDHGTDTGWVASYGTSQAMFQPLNINRGYFVMDGQYRNESDWFSGTAYGFAVTNSGYGDQIAINNGSTLCPNVTVKYVAIYNIIGTPTAAVLNCGIDCRNYTSSSVFNTGYVFSHIYQVGGNQHYWIGDTAMPTVEYCASYAISGNANNHCETVNLFYANQGGGTIRYNIFRDHCNGALGTSAGGSTGVIAIAYDGQNGGSTDIYGNVFDGWNAYAIAMDTWAGNRNIHVYNNTFVNRSGDTIYGTVQFQSANSPGNTCSNNLTCSSLVAFTGEAAFGDNSTVTSSAFVNYTARDYRLAQPTTAGIALPSPYNVDMLGNTRGVDGTWDRGAYEYVGVSTNAVIVVSPSSQNFGSVTVGTTSDLTFTVKNSGGSTLSGTASVSTPFSVIAGGTYSLGANQSEAVTVRFSPTTVGSNNSTVTFTGGGGATASVNGVGVGVAQTTPPAPTGLRIVQN